MKKKEEKKVKKVKGGLKLAKELLAKGETAEQVLSQLTKKYVKEGSDKVFAEKRAKIYLRLASKK